MKMRFQTLSFATAALLTVCLTGCNKEDKDAISMEDVNKGIQIVIGADGKEYQVVDLGLTSGNLWATCNLGADSPEQPGDFYAWGETEPKTQFGWKTYKWSDDDGVLIYKYSTSPDYGTPDQKITLDKDDEATVALLGEDWRIPSKQDFNELLTKKNCTVKYCRLNGVGGFLFTSVRRDFEGNSIFFPLAGMNDYDAVRYAGQYGWYWANTLYQELDQEKEKELLYTPLEATILWLEHGEIDNHQIKNKARRAGLPIRAIYVGRI